MPIRTYHDFILFTYEVKQDEHRRVQSFEVRVFDSPVGQGEQDETVPDPDSCGYQQDWYDRLQDLSRELEDRVYDRKLDKQRELGTKLGELLLPDRARKLLRESYNWLKPDEGLRLRLRLEPELADLPWEYIYLEDDGDQSSLHRFIALNPRISIVRHEALEIRAADFASAESQPGGTESLPPPEPRVEQPEGNQLPEPLREGTEGPSLSGQRRDGTEWLPPSAPAETRRIIIAMATPQPYQDYPPLKRLPQEQMEIREALDRIGGIKPTYLPEYRVPDDYAIRHGATFEELQAALSPTADILHFSGHGEFEKRVGPAGVSIEGEGWLILADEHNQAQRKSADDIRKLIEDTKVRLVVLGACESARRDRFHKLSSVSVSLLQGRIPCVVAMQFRILDPLAAIFMEAFYEALVAGLHIDEAVALGRATVWNRTQANGSYRRDWGVPVLYLRTPGGRIFPPVTDQGARQRAERRSRERFDLNRAWWDWMAEGTLATPDQLQRLAAAGDDLQLTPVQVLLLLRSAVKEDVSPAPWIRRLRGLQEASLAQLRPPGPEVSGSPSLARKILGLDESFHDRRPPSVDSLAWSATEHDDGHTRQAAALALAALKRTPKEGIDELEKALGRLGPWRSCRRRSELRGSLSDAIPEIEQLNRKLLPWDRLGVRGWRVWRRVWRDRYRLWALLAGGALGAGAGLGLLRLLLAILPEIFQPRTVLPGVQLAIYSYWGAIFGLFLCLGMLLADSLLLRPLRMPGEKPSKGGELPRLVLAVGLGTLTSGAALLLLSWLSGLNIAGKPLVAPLGFLFGLGMSLALYGPPGVSTCRDVLRASWRVALGAAFSVLTQLLFILARDKGLAITIAWPGTRYRAYLSATVERLWPDLVTRFPWWTDALGLVDAALVGAVLVIGTTIGLNVALRRLKARDKAQDAGGETGGV